jgi:hypothetical protein
MSDAIHHRRLPHPDRALRGRARGVRPDDLAAVAVRAIVERTGIDPERSTT